MGIFDVLGEMLKQVSDKNRSDEKVKTADPVVFEEVRKKLETVEPLPSLETVEPQPATVKTRADILREYREKLNEAQQENEASPVVETADRSVYDDLMAKLEQMREEDLRSTRESVYSTGNSSSQEAPPQQSSALPTLGSQAVTNSMGGSLALRSAPDMGASQSNIRVPDKSLLNIIEVSDKSINLDGKRSRFVLVEHQGQRGWILESYLNFN